MRGSPKVKIDRPTVELSPVGSHEPSHGPPPALTEPLQAVTSPPLPPHHGFTGTVGYIDDPHNLKKVPLPPVPSATGSWMAVRVVGNQVSLSVSVVLSKDQLADFQARAVGANDLLVGQVVAAFHEAREMARDRVRTALQAFRQAEAGNDPPTTREAAQNDLRQASEEEARCRLLPNAASVRITSLRDEQRRQFVAALAGSDLLASLLVSELRVGDCVQADRRMGDLVAGGSS
jgi:hypothetical protein